MDGDDPFGDLFSGSDAADTDDDVPDGVTMPLKGSPSEVAPVAASQLPPHTASTAAVASSLPVRPEAPSLQSQPATTTKVGEDSGGNGSSGSSGSDSDSGSGSGSGSGSDSDSDARGEQEPQSLSDALVALKEARSNNEMLLDARNRMAAVLKQTAEVGCMHPMTGEVPCEC